MLEINFSVDSPPPKDLMEPPSSETLLPHWFSDGRGILKAARPEGSIDQFIGLLAGRTKKKATIEEINEVAQKGWSGQVPG